MTQATEHLNEISSLVEQHRSWLTGLIASRCDDSAAAEDVLQEVSLAVVKATDRPKSETKTRSWLCAIALRQCALRIRRLVRQRRLLDGAADVQRGRMESTSDPLIWMMRSEHADLIRQAVSELDEETRWILLQKFQHRKTYAQIADALKLPSHKVEYRIVKARQLLHQKLIQLGIDQEVSS